MLPAEHSYRLGPLSGEARLLAAGMAFQQATDWHRQPPPLEIDARPPLGA
jgi:hypothetical protein